MLHYIFNIAIKVNWTDTFKLQRLITRLGVIMMERLIKMAKDGAELLIVLQDPSTVSSLTNSVN
jgi:hypothetical protein